jgi:hypothetical protein
MSQENPFLTLITARLLVRPGILGREVPRDQDMGSSTTTIANCHVDSHVSSWMPSGQANAKFVKYELLNFNLEV